MSRRRKGRTPFTTAVRLEIAKSHRLRGWVVVSVLTLTNLVMCAPLRPRVQEQLLSAPEQAWPALMLSCVAINALVGPILVSVLASRLTSVEHTGGGWHMSAAAGITPGRLCRAKTVALSGVLCLTVLAQVGGLLVWGYLVGGAWPTHLGPWAGYALALLAVDVLACAMHVLLAAVVENQLVCVGMGFLGSFVSLFSILMPDWLVRLVPWGYWAMISFATQNGEYGADGYAVVYTRPDLAWVGGFLVLLTVVFLTATARLDRIER